MLIHRIRAALKKFLFLEFNKEYLKYVEKAFEEYLVEESLRAKQAVIEQEEIFTRLLETQKRELKEKHINYWLNEERIKASHKTPVADYSEVETRKRNIEEGVMTGNSWVYKRK